MKFIGYLVSTILIIFASSIYSGYALTILWGWFVMPMFQVNELSIPFAIGLAIIIQYLTYQHKGNEQKEYGDALFTIATMAVIRPSTALLYGWIVTLFMQGA